MDSNAIGCVAEFKFGIECLKRGIIVSYPLLQSSLYDCIADTGDNIYRIQIKSTLQDYQKHRNTIHISWHHPYSKKDVDYFAIWVEKCQGFFIFKNDGKRLSVRVGNNNNNSKYFNNFEFK